MQVDPEKKGNVAEAFEEVVKLSEKYLDRDATKLLKKYFDLLIVVEDDDESYLANRIKTDNCLNDLILFIPKRIERLLELKAPQVIIDNERAALESIKKIHRNLS